MSDSCANTTLLQLGSGFVLPLAHPLLDRCAGGKKVPCSLIPAKLSKEALSHRAVQEGLWTQLAVLNSTDWRVTSVSQAGFSEMRAISWDHCMVRDVEIFFQ
ncbi:hypothetical protein Q9966_008745 [Columba livia]|nr:hypothetical protein Q9966_008745 [Columba livia]